MVNYTVGPFITFDGQITAREYEDNLGSQVHPMIQTLFPKKMQFSKMRVPPFTKLELFIFGLKRTKVNFSIPGQHNHQIWTSLKYPGEFWILE
jgi:hypothetical protein